MTRARDLGDFIADGAAAELVVDTTTLVVDSTNNRVGIGTASPSDDVEISTSADAKGLTLKNSGDVRPFLNFDANRSSAGNNLSQVNFKWNGTDIVRIIAVAGADTTNKDDGHLTFSTSSAGSPAERMRIDSSGNVGIGTAAPHDDGANFSTLTLNGAKGGSIVFSDDDVNQHQIYTTDDNSLRFARGSGLSSETMRLDSSGNVIIGATSALGKFHVKIDTNKNIAYSGAIGEVGSVPAIYAVNDAGNALESLGFRGTDIRFATQASERFRFGSSGQLGIGGATYGTSGQVLTSGGSGAAPTWADAGGGAYELIQKQTVSSNVTSITFSTITAPQEQLVLILNGVRLSSDGQIFLYYLDSSGNYLTNGGDVHTNAAFYFDSGGNHGDANQETTYLNIHRGIDIESSSDFNAQLNFFGWGTATPHVLGKSVYRPNFNSDSIGGQIAARFNGTTTPVQILLDANTASHFTAGEFYLYKLV